MTTAMEDREKELRFLLNQISTHPERDWTEARARVQVLTAMGVSAGKISA